MKNNWLRKSRYVVLIVGASLFTSISGCISQNPPDVTISELVIQAESQQVDTILQQGDTLTGLKGTKEISHASFVGTTEELRKFLA